MFALYLGCGPAAYFMTLLHIHHTSQDPKRSSNLSLGDTFLIAEKKWKWLNQMHLINFRQRMCYFVHIPLAKASHTGRMVSLS